jgi:alpha-tubulin suppressor-like RCC1 family protein
MRRLLLVVATLAIGACGSSTSAPEDAAPSTPGTASPAPPTFEGKAGGGRVRQIALGTIAACALLEDATVACYGGGIVGTLGRGDRPETDPVPRPVPGLAKVAKIFGGGYTMCAVLEDRTVTCWGADQSQNPYGARPGDRFTVEGLGSVVDLAVATSHTCALVDGGDLECFGSNYFGELGDGTTNNAKKPVRVAKVHGVKAVATGAELTCAIVADGSVVCWGLNDQGQLGQGDHDMLIHPDPVTVPGLDAPARSLAASSISGAVCAALENGTTRCWGEKLAGAPAGGGARVAVGWNHACVLDGAGAVSCWGGNAKGQLGSASKALVASPEPIPGIAGAIGLSTGGDSSCAVFGDGSFACWGEDSRGQLGDGTAGGTKASPTRVQSLY